MKLALLDAIPTEAFKIDPFLHIEADPLFLEEIDLCSSHARPSFRVHHPLPGNKGFDRLPPQCRQRPADPPGCAGWTDEIRHLAVGRYPSGWNLSNHMIDSVIDALTHDRPLCPFAVILVE